MDTVTTSATRNILQDLAGFVRDFVVLGEQHLKFINDHEETRHRLTRGATIVGEIVDPSPHRLEGHAARFHFILHPTQYVQGKLALVLQRDNSDVRQLDVVLERDTLSQISQVETDFVRRVGQGQLRNQDIEKL